MSPFPSTGGAVDKRDDESTDGFYPSRFDVLPPCEGEGREVTLPSPPPAGVAAAAREGLTRGMQRRHREVPRLRAALLTNEQRNDTSKTHSEVVQRASEVLALPPYFGAGPMRNLVRIAQLRGAAIGGLSADESAGGRFAEDLT